MKALLQRVSQASVTVDGRCVGAIGPGLLIFLGVTHSDSSADVRYLAEKCVNLRIFADCDGKMNLSVKETGGKALIISQFTLYSDGKSGRRPGFTSAAAPEVADKLYEEFCTAVAALGVEVQKGIFGADMDVALHNDGPVTLLLESK